MLSITLSATLSNIWTSLKESFKSESKDVGDFIQIEIEDNGKGIGPKDLPYISTVFTVQMFHEILPKAEAESVFPL